MFESLEKQAGGLCAVVFLAVIILGKMFGARLVGLVPLAACIGSGIWLWMKEVVRSGREVEWHSEKDRGLTVSCRFPMVDGGANFEGHRQSATRVC
jgi:hypothetical protein